MNRQAIDDIIETNVNPILQEHRGWIELEDWDEGTGVLIVRFRGACAGCQGTQKTLNETVMPILRVHIPELREVELDDGISQELYDSMLSMFSTK